MMDDEEYEYERRYNRNPRTRIPDSYEITGKKQRIWILVVICVPVLVGLAYVLSQFG